MGRPVIFPLNLNTKLSRLSRSGTWTSSWSEPKGKFRLPNLAYHSAKLYKERTKRWHDKQIRIKQFKPGDKFLILNSRVHLFGHGKFRSKWEDPYLVLHIVDHGGVTLQCDDGDTFKANGQHLKLFFVQNPQNFEEVDILDFLETE
jgi:hypothetical protein